MSDERCETCQFSRRTGFGGLWCRRHAPTLHGTCHHDYDKAKWPVVHEQMWCGDYERTTETK